jgi:hypothetical protein
MSKKHISGKGIRRWRRSVDRNPFRVTYGLTTCADGTADVPLYVIHEGSEDNEKLREKHKQELSECGIDIGVGLTANAQMTKTEFSKWCQHFVKHKREGAVHNNVCCSFLVYFTN